MTFIATVVAKKGAALIADSLVTTSRLVLSFDDYFKYIQTKSGENGAEIKIDHKEVARLFRRKPTHTKDYQEKLFKYDSHTAICIAGSADLNKKPLDEIIASAIENLKPTLETEISKRVEDLRLYFENEAREALNNEITVKYSVMIVTFYSPSTHKTTIYKIHVNETRKKDLEENPDYKIVTATLQPEEFAVVCDGQNKISENILFGGFNFVYEVIPSIARKIIKDFNIDETTIPQGYIENLFKDPEILTEEFMEDIKMNKITELSLQQAIDLACLLLRIERDIQRYTENIPTVGGVVKIAIIDDQGFD